MLIPAMIFADHMVLQRQKPIPIWGQASPGAEIRVHFGGASVHGSADETGRWRVTLPPMEAAVHLVMTITDGTESLVLNDICVGEVWLAGGQSNMEFLLYYDAEYDENVTLDCNPLVRFFDYPKTAYEGAIQDYDFSKYGFWRSCRSEDLAYFSAVGYYFARNLQKALQVPVGIVGCNWGGTPACAWMDPEYLRNTLGEVWLDDHARSIEHFGKEAMQEEFRNNPRNDRSDPLGNQRMVSLMKYVMPVRQQREMASLMRKEMTPASSVAFRSRPGGLYKHMVKKIAPYAMRGVLWYQGETDGDLHPEAYVEVFPQLIHCWRDLWQEPLPFLFVQLAPFHTLLTISGASYGIVRAAQEMVSRRVPNVWMTTAGDVGNCWDVHPKQKRPVGERLALLARGHVYGEDILCDAPEAISAKRQGDEIVISFEYADGLYLRGQLLNAMQGLLSDGSFVSLPFAEVYGNQLVLFDSPEVTELHFARIDYYEVNLFNAANIPAKPFVLKVE